MSDLIVGLYEDWLWLDERIEALTGEIEQISHCIAVRTGTHASRNSLSAILKKLRGLAHPSASLQPRPSCAKRDQLRLRSTTLSCFTINFVICWLKGMNRRSGDEGSKTSLLKRHSLPDVADPSPEVLQRRRIRRL